MSDELRQTGRTTKQLKQAYMQGSVFVVHSYAMRDYARRLLMKRLDVASGEVPIIVLSPKIHEDLRGCSNPVVDHAVWEAGDPRDVDRLRYILPQVTSP